MEVIEGSGEIPAIFSAHHASHDFGPFDRRVALTDEQKVRFSDYGTADTVPLNGLATLIAGHSRALGDLNRDPDDPGRFQDQDYARPDRHNIWLPGQSLSGSEKLMCQQIIHDKYHNSIVDLLRERTGPTFVIAWDNTAHYVIGPDSSGDDIMMKPFIISNRGKEGSPEPGTKEPVSCDPGFLWLFASEFKGELASRDLPTEIVFNTVYYGGYIARRYSTLRNKKELERLGISAEVQSFQIEYDTHITHNQETLQFYKQRADALREAASIALKSTFEVYGAKR
jgi:N-formylglutamate amidohydrolase